MDQNQGQRRGHFRGRRGPDRRSIDRRSQPQPTQERGSRDQVDVEQIMREIRGRIAQRQGIDLSNQQIQDLAARRLESILDPRAIKPSLLEALRRSASTPSVPTPDRIPNEPAYSFEDTTIYDSHRGLMRFMRRLLNPILKLFFNPNPLIRALHIQAKLNVEAAERDAERDRRQTEWNALHYEIVQRLVTEVSRTSLEVQALSLRVESLDAKVEFNERRVRGIEGSVHRARPQASPGRPTEQPAPAPSPFEGEIATSDAPNVMVDAQPASDGARRRRRRRRGRRSGGGAGDLGHAGGAFRPEPMPAGGETVAETAETMEQAPDTGIYESPPVPFGEARTTGALEQPAIEPVPAPQSSTLQQTPAPLVEDMRQPVGPAAVSGETAAQEPPDAPADAGRNEY